MSELLARLSFLPRGLRLRLLDDAIWRRDRQARHLAMHREADMPPSSHRRLERRIKRQEDAADRLAALRGRIA